MSDVGTGPAHVGGVASVFSSSSLDTRRNVLDRLFDLLSAIVPPGNAFHNRGELPIDKRPAIVLLDGDELVTGRTLNQGRGRVIQSPTMMTLRPQIFFLAKPNPPTNEGVVDTINDARAAIVRAIITDITLVNLIGGPRGNGQIRYRGSDTDMKTGSSMRGELQVTFEIDYDLHPESL
jgi:hypothetical protein